jgi:monoterpene epsilon-lactone hydrolase
MIQLNGQSNSLSMRAQIIRACLHILVKRSLRAASSVQAARRHVKLHGLLVSHPPRGTETIAVDAGGVKADRISTGASRNDRHILYLHGGCYVVGWPGLYRDLTWRIATLCRSRVCASIIGLRPSIPFRQHSTMPWQPTAGCLGKARIRTALR